MADLTAVEKNKLEKLLGMGGGYVLDFSNRSFTEFVLDVTERDILDAKYAYASGSKANRLRAFWTTESNHTVAKLLAALIERGQDDNRFADSGTLPEECKKIVDRLARGEAVADIFSAPFNERDFEAVAGEVREAIEKNRPDLGLDRLHTFVVKYFRTLCKARSIAVPVDKPLHSLVGEYVKQLRAEGVLHAEMTDRILRSTISVFEAFNQVRNEQSLAHDNPILNHDESLLIFNHVASVIRFVRSIEGKRVAELPNEIPF